MRATHWILAFAGVIAFSAPVTRSLQAAPSPSPVKLTMPNAPINPSPNALNFAYGAAATLSDVKRQIVGGTPGVEALLTTDTANTLTIGAKKYRLIRFHFHRAWEHTLIGQQDPHPMEMHMVHYELTGPNQDQPDPNKRLAVGRWISVGAANDELNKIIKDEADYPLANIANFDLTKLIPAANDRLSWRYSGSLTSDATTAVEWVFLKSQLTMTQAQIDKISLLFPANAHAAHDVEAGHMLTTDIPAPASAAMLALVGMAATRRRRSLH